MKRGYFSVRVFKTTKARPPFGHHASVGVVAYDAEEALALTKALGEKDERFLWRVDGVVRQGGVDVIGEGKDET